MRKQDIISKMLIIWMIW